MRGRWSGSGRQVGGSVPSPVRRFEDLCNTSAVECVEGLHEHGQRNCQVLTPQTFDALDEFDCSRYGVVRAGSAAMSADAVSSLRGSRPSKRSSALARVASSLPAIVGLRFEKCRCAARPTYSRSTTIRPTYRSCHYPHGRGARIAALARRP
jgi:hypothetical protein